MAIYSARVALAGNRNNEVVKPAVSIPELVLLKAIHGEGAVSDVTLVDKAKNVPLGEDASNERERLVVTYGDAYVNQFLGPATAPLPKEIPGLQVITAPARVVSMQNLAE